MALAPPHAEPALLMWQCQHAQLGVPHPATLVPSSIGRRRPCWRPPALAHLALCALAPGPPSHPCAGAGAGWFDGAEPCNPCALSPAGGNPHAGSPAGTLPAPPCCTSLWLGTHAHSALEPTAFAPPGPQTYQAFPSLPCRPSPGQGSPASLQRV